MMWIIITVVQLLIVAGLVSFCLWRNVSLEQRISRLERKERKPPAVFFVHHAGDEAPGQRDDNVQIDESTLIDPVHFQDLSSSRLKKKKMKDLEQLAAENDIVVTDETGKRLKKSELIGKIVSSSVLKDG